MSRIAFRVVSVELNDFTLGTINKDNLVKLNVIQKPSKANEEYLLKNTDCLKGINHEFAINDPSNKIEKLVLTVRSVVKKPTFFNFFNFDNNTSMKKSKDHSVDRYVDRSKENYNGHVKCEYIEPKHSLIGYCAVDLKEIEKGVNNSMRVELLTRGNAKVVGFANIDIYMWNCPKANTQQKESQKNDEPILFVDPGCPVSNNPSLTFE